MPSTHLSLHFHVVFSTKDRQPAIGSDWMPRLHAYLGGAIRTLHGIPEEVGGVSDHVHILLGLKATHSVAEFMRDIKRQSSLWVHETIGQKSFGWQEGYGAFTVSPSHREAVRSYIQHQGEHHRKKTFQAEYREFLERAGVEYDENYLW